MGTELDDVVAGNASIKTQADIDFLADCERLAATLSAPVYFKQGFAAWKDSLG